MAAVTLQMLRGNRRGYGFCSSSERDGMDGDYGFCASVPDIPTAMKAVEMIRGGGRRVFGASLSYFGKGKDQPRVIVSTSGENIGRLESLAWLLGDGILTPDKIKKALTVH